MTTFKMPEPTLHESGPTDYFGRLLCYTKEDMKNALRDVLEQAAKICDERANGENDAQWCADRIRSLK